VLSRLDEEVAAAHRGVEHVQPEHGLDLLLVAPRALDCLPEHGPDGLLDDVLHDVVRRVVAAGRLALALIVEELDRPALRLGQRFEVIFEEALVDRTEVPLGEVAVVHELPFHAGEEVYGRLQVGVADGAVLQERVPLRVEEAAVERRDGERWATLVDDVEELLEAGP
jgi:hypothetical protein